MNRWVFLLLFFFVTIATAYSAVIEKESHRYTIQNVVNPEAETYVVKRKKQNNAEEPFFGNTEKWRIHSKDKSNEKKSSENKHSIKKTSLHIRFLLNKSVLTGEMKKALNTLTNIKIVGQIILIGYTCQLGTEELNNNLALERAKSVARYLGSIVNNNLKTYAKSKCCYLSDVDYALNRRVEVLYIEAPKVTDVPAIQ
jgi:outer membrane protein OmpA-like peptidoglycan-associated protein